MQNSHLNPDFWVPLKLLRSVTQSFCSCTATLSEDRGARAAAISTQVLTSLTSVGFGI